MIVLCPGCGSRYRLDETRLVRQTARLKCPGCAAVFTVERPTVAAPRETGAVPPTVSAPGGRPSERLRTALLADEAREFRDFALSTLEDCGFEVTVTDNGEEALILSGSHRFDLILLNAYLRRLVGLQVCQRIKASPRWQETPVILIGSLFDGASQAEAMSRRYGADDLIEPSVSREELQLRIRRALEAPRKPASPASAGAEPEALGEEGEIRRLARIMVSDLAMYHPHRFSRALKQGDFFEAFARELVHGREMVEGRFPRIPARLQLLSAGLREALKGYRVRNRS